MIRVSQVYFASVALTDVYKLGVSMDPHRAVAAISHPLPLSLRFMTPGDRKLKNKIGRYLTRHRIDRHSKDWYHLTSAEIRALIGELREEGPGFLELVRKIDEPRRQAVKASKREVRAPA